MDRSLVSCLERNLKKRRGGRNRARSAAEGGEPSYGSSEHLVLAHDHVTAHDGGDGPAGDGKAGEGRPAAGRDEPTLLDAPLPPHIDERQVAVIAAGEAALVEKAIDARRASAHQIDEA